MYYAYIYIKLPSTTPSFHYSNWENFSKELNNLSGGESKGTGGSDFMPYLKKHRDETQRQKLVFDNKNLI